MDTLTSHDTPSLEQRARRRVSLKKGWLVHATVFVLVNAGLWLVWQASAWGDMAHMHPHGFHSFRLWGWGLGLAIHGLVVLAKLQGEGLTERMVEREIEALKRREGAGR
jgi:GNAT superfamily N-acetyltransferase